MTVTRESTGTTGLTNASRSSGSWNHAVVNSGAVVLVGLAFVGGGSNPWSYYAPTSITLTPNGQSAITMTLVVWRANNNVANATGFTAIYAAQTPYGSNTHAIAVTLPNAVYCWAQSAAYTGVTGINLPAIAIGSSTNPNTGTIVSATTSMVFAVLGTYDVAVSSPTPSGVGNIASQSATTHSESGYILDKAGSATLAFGCTANTAAWCTVAVELLGATVSLGGGFSWVSTTYCVHEVSNANCPVPTPVGLQANDIVMFFVYVGYGTTYMSYTVTPPTNVVEVTGSPAINSYATYGFYLHIYYYRATGSESGYFTFSTGANTPLGLEGWASVYRGAVASGSPIDTNANASNQATSTVPPVLSITTQVANELVLWVCSNTLNVDPGTPNSPVAFTSRVYYKPGDDSPCSIADYLNATAGALSSITSSDTTAGYFADWVGALKPASNAGTIGATTKHPDVAAFTGQVVAVGGTIGATTKHPDLAAFAGYMRPAGTIGATTRHPDLAALSGYMRPAGTIGATTKHPDLAALAGVQMFIGTVAATTRHGELAALSGYMRPVGTIAATAKHPDLAALAGAKIYVGAIAATFRNWAAGFPYTLTLKLGGAAGSGNIVEAAFTGAQTSGETGTLATTTKHPDRAALAATLVESGTVAATTRHPDLAALAGWTTAVGTVATTTKHPDLAVFSGVVAAFVGAISSTTRHGDLAALSGYMRPVGTLATTTRHGDLAALAGVQIYVATITATTKHPDLAALVAQQIYVGNLAATTRHPDLAALSGYMAPAGTLAATTRHPDLAALTGVQIYTGTIAATTRHPELAALTAAQVYVATIAVTTKHPDLAALVGAMFPAGTLAATTRHPDLAALAATAFLPAVIAATTRHGDTAAFVGLQKYLATVAATTKTTVGAAALVGYMRPAGVIAVTTGHPDLFFARSGNVIVTTTRHGELAALTGVQIYTGTLAATTRHGDLAALSAAMWPTGALAATTRHGDLANIVAAQIYPAVIAATTRHGDLAALAGYMRPAGAVAATVNLADAIRWQAAINGYMRPTGTIAATAKHPDLFSAISGNIIVATTRHGQLAAFTAALVETGTLAGTTRHGDLAALAGHLTESGTLAATTRHGDLASLAAAQILSGLLTATTRHGELAAFLAYLQPTGLIAVTTRHPDIFGAFGISGAIKGPMVLTVAKAMTLAAGYVFITPEIVIVLPTQQLFDTAAPENLYSNVGTENLFPAAATETRYTNA